MNAWVVNGIDVIPFYKTLPMVYGDEFFKDMFMLHALPQL